MNLCSGCGEDFGSVAAFDAHRAGRFDVNWPEDLDGRHCMDEDEMVLRGLVRNSRGRWSLATSLESARSIAAGRQRETLKRLEVSEKAA